MKIVFDQYAYAKNIYESIPNGVRISNRLLLMIAKYLRANGFSKKRIYEALSDFLKINSSYYDVLKNHNRALMASNEAMKHSLPEHFSIPITEAELWIIERESDFVLRKILFFCLVLAKFQKFNSKGVDSYPGIGYHVFATFEDILDSANCRVSVKERSRIKAYLGKEKKYILATFKDFLWELTYAKDDSKTIAIIDCKKPVTDQMPFFCCRCGKVVQSKRNNRHTMCESCKLVAHKERHIRYNKKRQRHLGVCLENEVREQKK